MEKKEKEKVYMPSQAQFKSVIKLFESVNSYAKKIEKEEIDMYNGDICNLHNCNTPMCHAGWAAFAENLKLKNNNFKSFYDGAIIIANKLGFLSMEQLEIWSADYQKLWGNDYGSNMFLGEEAFITGKMKKLTSLQQIIDHWKKVAKRTDAYCKKLGR